MERNQRRPPDVNEALSSMLWTPYERTPSESSSDDDERLNAKLKKSKSTFDYSFPTKPQHNTTQYVPSFRKIDNFRFSYPYYGPVPIVQKCITELPSYESLYQNNVTPELSRIVGMSSGGGGGRLVHSFTDNFILQNRPSSAGIVVYDPPPGSALLGITSSTSGFSNNFTDDDDVEDDDDEDDEDFDESPNNNNNGPIPAQSFSMIPFEQSTGPQQYEYSPKAAGGSLPRLHRILVAEETKEWHQWPTDSQSGGMDAAQSDNNGDLLLTKNNNISQQQPQQLQQHARKYQFELQQEQQQLRQQQRSQDQLRLGMAAQTMATAAAGRDRDVAVVCVIQDLPGEINRSATLKHSTLTTIAPEEILSVSETSCTNNGEKPDTKCVRSVQTDLVFSSSRLVEANVRCETASSVRKFFGLNASVDTTSNRRKANASATTTTTSESSQLNPISVIDVDDNANERNHHDPRRSLILDVRDSLLAMRLNIPAAQPSIVDPLKGTSIVSNNNNGNGGSAITTTSVFLPLNESLVATRIGRGRNVNSSANTVISEVHSSGAGTVTTTGSAIVQSKPSLTIQVNQGDEIRSSRDSATSISAISGEGFTNQCAGISVVNCYSGSSVPSSCSVNNSATNVVTTSISSASADDTLSSGINSVNITSVSSSSDCDISNNSAVQNNGLQSSSATSRQHQQDPVDRQPNQSIHRPLARTFTSTECQTDDLPLVDRNEISAAIAQSQTEALISREQRRRERRERRMQGRTRHPHILPPMHHQPPPPPPPAMVRPMLPDILHSHFPPPYTALQSLANPPPPPPPSSMIAPVISTVPMATATAVTDGRFTIPLPVIRRSPSERSGKGCCGQWFAGPPLRALIAVVALGGVACALGGAALGATGLAGPPTSHLTAALLMIGVGVILVTVSGAAWRMTAPGGPPCLGLGSTVDLARCGRRPCNSRGAPHGLLYPEFQHRPPPPSYQASMQEYRLRLLLLDRDRQNGVVRGGSPPPTYRSHAGSLLRAPLSTTGRNGGNGSEYSLPPSYRSRSVNTNTNTSSISRPSVAGHGENSMESLNSTCAPNRSNQNTLSSRSDNGTVLQNNTTTTTATTTTLMDNFPGTISLIPESTASSIAVTYPSSASTTVLSSSSTTTAIATTTTIPTTKESVHTIAIEAAGATRHSQQQQQQLQQFSFNPSQNLNDKLNPRVTNSNNNNNVKCNNSSKTSNSMNSSSSTSINCTKSHGSPARLISSPFMSTMSSNLTNVSATTPKDEQTPAAGGSRKELVTIVTISSSSQEPETSASEMEILAHL